MQNHTKLPDWTYADGCPVHGGGIKKIYEYGHGDAEVTVFTSCHCAVAQQLDPVGVLTYAPVYFTKFDDAAGLARLSKACQAHLHTEL